VSQAASRGMQGDDLAENLLARSDEDGRLQRVDLESVYEPIAAELAQVEQLLQIELRNQTPWVDQLMEHNWINGGKRIRPVFLLLSGACCGKLQQSHLQMAAAVEMVHAATLIHDDILDKAATRRHQPTVNAKWGNRVSVLLGDFLFTHAFHLASVSLSVEAVKMLAESSNRVCEGEIQQNAWQGNFDLSEKDYLSMISHKTAELCGCSCRLGALLSDAPAATIEEFGAYGRNLGVAFQIIDDVLDLVGSQTKVGKTLGTDLVNQKSTLPIIHCLKNSNDDERSRLEALLKSESTSIDDVIPFLDRTSSIEYARSVAQDHAENALRFAEPLDRGRYSFALRRLAKFVLDRTH
jgi:octaprenyl-diphosphate synthase